MVAVPRIRQAQHEWVGDEWTEPVPWLRQAQSERLAQAQENTTNSIASHAYSKSSRAQKHLNP